MKSKVYFIKIENGLPVEKQAQTMKKLYEFSGARKIISDKDFVAIKVHVGEKGNTTYVKPELVRVIADGIKEAGGVPFLTETATLYKGERENAVKHLLHAHKHGFTIDRVGAPFIMADGLLGNTESEVTINCELNEKVNIAREILSSDVLFLVSHPTGHVVSGLGASIKNLGMGLASRKGKLIQHSEMKPKVKEECIFCKKCMQWCPKEAIIEKDNKAWIIPEKCIGCGECLAVCRFNAIAFDWKVEAGFMQKNMVEHAYGAVKDRKCFYFNVMIDMTKDCDCWWEPPEKIIDDIGILASNDPVAIDLATLDLTAKFNKSTLAKLAYGNQDALIQIEHGAKIGLGSLDYELIMVE